ncbi:MAG TPA: methylenetetrahydrofolate reductase C-terminal domain-containing protein [Dehalococcoidales bacterium]|nr:methylenetetrahydrofolate reductase C-terminal domain-containing protein [Dehalococcoidales bacterium]
MIVAEQKPLPEIRQMIAPYKRILILGCGTCMTVCDAGGEREVTFMDNALRLMQARDNKDFHEYSEFTVKRQCDPEFMDILLEKVKDFDAVLSMGCGIGVQTVAEKLDIPVLPGLNTSFMGASQEQGVWDERCSACGDCRLDDTAGICPVTRCTKGILNGPCAGVKNEKCEANKEINCAWVLIYKRLEKTGQLDKIRREYPMRNFRAIPRPRRLTKTSAGGISHG